jgi:hypothetical protein
MELYEAIPMPDGNPLEHIKISAILVCSWYLVLWIYYKIKDKL